MKTTIFSDISSLEDIQKQKLRLEKKMREAGKKISAKTDVTKLLFSNKSGLGEIFGKEGINMELIGSFLPLGITYILEQLENNPHKSLFKRLIIYSALGGLTALLVYHYLKGRKAVTEE